MNAPACFEPKVGVFPGVPEHVYRGAPGINQSLLSAILRSPKQARWRMQYPTAPTASMQLGTAVHCAVLEPEKFAERYVRAEFDDFRSKDAKAWRDEQQAAGRIVLKHSSDSHPGDPSEWDRVQAIAEAATSHPMLSKVLNGAHRELALWWKHADDTLCKGLIDAYHPGYRLALDLKTVPAGGAAERDFARKVFDFDYALQAAFYMDGYLAATGEVPTGFIFACVETEPPYDIALYVLDTEWVLQGKKRYHRAIEILAECVATDCWPGYPDEIQILTQPAWVKTAGDIA
jgi:hypothetical protein